MNSSCSLLNEGMPVIPDCTGSGVAISSGRNANDFTGAIPGRHRGSEANRDRMEKQDRMENRDKTRNRDIMENRDKTRNRDRMENQDKTRNRDRIVNRGEFDPREIDESTLLANRCVYGINILSPNPHYVYVALMRVL